MVGHTFVAAELIELQPGRALDLAAGEDRNALWLAERGWEVTAVDFSQVGLHEGWALQAQHPHGRDMHVDWAHAVALSFGPGPVTFDVALVAYLPLPANERRPAVRRAFDCFTDGATLLFVAHDSTNLTEGTDGPQDATCSTPPKRCSATSSVNASTSSARSGPRVVPANDEHRGEPDRPAYDALVRLVRTG